MCAVRIMDYSHGTCLTFDNKTIYRIIIVID